MARAINQDFNIFAFEDYMNTQQKLLPELPETTSLTSRVVRVLGANPGQMQLQGTNTYLFGTGCERLLVDTGEGVKRWAELISSFVAEHDIMISKVLLTHWHGDHTGGISDLVKIFPQLKSQIYKNKPDADQQPIHDGQIFRVEGATLRAVFTPGHSKDHMCFVLEEEHALVTGDNLLGHGTTAVEDLNDYMESLQIMARQKCAIGYPGHGAVIERLRQKLTEEIGTKMRRERQVINALRHIQKENINAKLTVPGRSRARRGATPYELVSHVFGNLPNDVVDNVFVPFMQELLKKLARDKRIGFESKCGQQQWFAFDMSTT